MATMFPSEIKYFTTPGEEKVYNFLHVAARPDYMFLAWYSPDIEDREPDFILFSPDSGLIVLEVKDWQANQIIEMDPKSALLNIGGHQERRKQPLAQAREYVNSLLSLLGDINNGKTSLPCPVERAAVFPHIRRDEFISHQFNKVIDEAKVLCWDDLDVSSPLVRDVTGQKFREWLKEHFPPRFYFRLSPAQINNLRNKIFPIVRIELPTRSGISQKNTILSMDYEQENFARQFGPGKMLIMGPSGSGKTLVLAHQAWHLPRVDKNIRRILIICFNFSLVGYIRRMLARKKVSLGVNGVEVIPFFSICERILGENLSHANEGSDYYELIVRESLERLQGDHPLKGHWDAILVDEGQDFSQDMARVILALLRKKGALTVAEDENQQLYKTGSSVWANLNIADLKIRHLHKQYRCTREISYLASKLLDGEQASHVAHAGASGSEPVWIFSGEGQKLIEDVANAVEKLCEMCPMGDIGILYVSKNGLDINNIPENLIEALEARGLLARWVSRNINSKKEYDISTDSVTISTIHSAKGLDFAHVLLLGLDRLAENNEHAKKLAYVGITRARESLTLFIQKETDFINRLRSKK